MEDSDFFEDLPSSLLEKVVENTEYKPETSFIPHHQNHSSEDSILVIDGQEDELEEEMLRKTIEIEEQELITISDSTSFEKSIISEKSPSSLIESSVLDSSFGFHSIDKPSPVNWKTNKPSVDRFVSNKEDRLLEYDPKTIKDWIYPTNYPLRKYQFDIVKKALFKNTLVCLPTGLGKTFIAAVVMFNYFRWFPKSKIIFMAPTKPLVNQQIEACYKICGIPYEELSELNGSQNASRRKLCWDSKSVFFATPQTVYNDLRDEICSAKLISCLVVDEAHKSTGNYAYSTVIRELVSKSKDGVPYCRILALSATPGSRIENVQDVVNNCHINSIEARTEKCEDIKPYTFEKNVEKIIVQLQPEHKHLVDEFMNLMQECLTKLKNVNLIPVSNIKSCSTALIIKYRLEFRTKYPGYNKKPPYNNAEMLFAQLIMMIHSLELLTNQGVHQFYLSIAGYSLSNNNNNNNYNKQNIGDISMASELPKYKSELIKNPRFVSIMNMAKKYIYKPEYINHPKLDSLKKKLLEYLNVSSNKNSRIMVFAEYRETIDEIYKRISSFRPIIRPICFIGQSSKNKKGLKQSDQLEILEDFKKGDYNVMISTCIGEEGLDIGDLDLIVCYDSHSSPLRMLQRTGRTGRNKNGNVCLLLTKDFEERKYTNSNSAQKHIYKLLMTPGKINLCDKTSNIIPDNIYSICTKKEIMIPDLGKHAFKKKAKSKKMRDDTYQSGILNDSELEKFKLTHKIPNQNIPNNFKYNIWQNKLSPTHIVGHSDKSRFLTKTLNKLRQPQEGSSETVESKKKIQLKDFSFNSVLPGFEDTKTSSKDHLIPLVVEKTHLSTEKSINNELRKFIDHDFNSNNLSSEDEVAFKEQKYNIKKIIKKPKSSSNTSLEETELSKYNTSPPFSIDEYYNTHKEKGKDENLNSSAFNEPKKQNNVCNKLVPYEKFDQKIREENNLSAIEESFLDFDDKETSNYTTDNLYKSPVLLDILKDVKISNNDDEFENATEKTDSKENDCIVDAVQDSLIKDNDDDSDYFEISINDLLKFDDMIVDENGNVDYLKSAWDIVSKNPVL